MFNVEDGVGVSNRGDDQPLRVRRSGRDDDLEAWNMREPGLQRLTHICIAVHHVRRANHHGDGHGAVVDVARLRPRVDERVHRYGYQARELHLDNGSQTHERRAHRHAGEPCFGDRHVHDALRTELLKHPLGDSKDAAVVRDVFTQEVHRFVAVHLLCETFPDRGSKLKLSHSRMASMGSLYTLVNA